MRSLATVFFLIPVLWAHAQADELIIQGQTGGLYLEHSVAARETWYSVGRMYNVDPKALAKYNHLTFAHPLGIGEEVKIPLTAGNFSQDGKKPAGESLVPVYHIVQEKEWLYRISVNHNKVPIPVLEKWNHVKGDQVHAGLHMIVGYLKVKTALSALAGRGPSEKEKKDTVAAAPVATSPVTAAPSPASPVTAAPVTATPSPAAPSPAPVYKAPASVTSVTSPTPHFDGGKFKADFTDGGKSVNGFAGIFKSTSGWQDGKYYALINNVSVGTIVKITDQASGKSVYAKVLGQLPDMRESAGLAIRVSNAAAAELGEAEGRFTVAVSY